MSLIEGEQRWTLHIRKDTLKFSAAHMTVFADGSKECLHGHNYQVELQAELAQSPVLPRMLGFDTFKQALRLVCEAWDEKVLIATQNPWMELLAGEEDEYNFRLCGKRYMLPLDEVALLPVDNITAENLAQLLCQRFLEELFSDRSIAWEQQLNAVCLRIEESPGQGATYTLIRPKSAIRCSSHP